MPNAAVQPRTIVAGGVTAGLAHADGAEGVTGLPPIRGRVTGLPPIRGRRLELHAIRQRIAQLCEGRGGCLLIDGPPGIGKTRLLAELAELARHRGLVVASAACDELDRHAPMLPLLTALRAGPNPVLPASELDSVAIDAGRRFWFLERLRDILEQRSRQTPLVIMLDDLQWADAVTLMALRTLCPQLDTSAVLWAFAHHPGQGSADLHRVLDRFLARNARRLSLTALDSDDALELATDVLGCEPSAKARALIADTRGSPFLITELLRSAVEENILAEPWAATVRAGVPERFARHIRRRLRGVSPGVRHLLEVGAVLGRSFMLDDAARVLGRPAGLLIGTLATALDTELIVAEQDQLVFRHQLIHRAIYDELPGAMRIGLHREAARLLLEAGRSAGEVAEHLLVAARAGDSEAVGTLLAAVADISRSSPEAGAELAVRTLDLLGRDDARRPRLLATIIELFTRTRRIGEARALAEAALGDELPAEVEGTIRFAVATGLNLTGDARAALAEAASALALPGLPTTLRADLKAAEAAARLQVRDLAGAEQCAAESLRLGDAERPGPPTVSAMTLTSQIAYYRGRVSDALITAQKAVRILLDEPAARDRLPRLWLTRVLLASDQPAEADGVSQEGEHAATEIEAAWSRPYWHLCRARGHLECGQLADAARDAETGQAIAEELGLARAAAEAHAVLGQVAFHQGDLAGAESHVRAAELAAGGLTADPAARWVKVMLADALGSPDRALDIAFEDGGSTGQDRLAMLLEIGVTAIPYLARMALRARRRDDCRDLVTHAQRLAEANPGLAITTGIAAHAEGIAHRDPDALGRAVAAYQQTGRRLAAAMAGEDLGRALLHAGDRAAAIVHLRRALTTAAEIGALRHADRIRRVLREAGVRHRFSSPRREVTFGWGSLTDAELRVASLAVEGLTNQAIADRLFLSPHTINTHLRHVFSKLGVNSRVGLTRIVLAEMPRAASN
jgi:ATP/maltotriose-dependent transcriptional regulator MalT